MNYEKLTVEKFAEKLSAGQYSNLTGARRAIGKTAAWTHKQREAAKMLAEKHFGPSEKAGKATKKSGKAAKKPAPKAVTPAASAAPVAAATKPVLKKPALRIPAPIDGPFALTVEQIAGTPHQAVSIADRTINCVSTAITTVRAMKESDPNLDISEILETGAAAIRKSVALLDQTIDPIYSASPVPKSIGDVFPNGVAHAVPETADSAPPASDPDLDPHEMKLFNDCADAAIRAERTPEQVRLEAAAAAAAAPAQ